MKKKEMFFIVCVKRPNGEKEFVEIFDLQKSADKFILEQFNDYHNINNTYYLSGTYDGHVQEWEIEYNHKSKVDNWNNYILPYNLRAQ